ncbi:MAG: hypothetical protein IJ945_02100 [Oscillospiraceae bacterium]|nr:hypothetical protein [Oscillospiraceae bacterium]
MKKLLALVLAMMMLCSCGVSEEPAFENPESTPEKNEEPQEEEQEEIFFTSIVTDESTEKAYLEKTDEVFSPLLIKPEEVIMPKDRQEIYDKYVAPIGNPMPLHTEFSEDSAPEVIYTYIFNQCKSLDKKVLGINRDYRKEGTEGESIWVGGRYAEETIRRWFGWEPEDYRDYFPYDAEKDMYFLAACGGGPSYHYVTDYSFKGDMLYINYSSYYNGPLDSEFPEMEFLFVYYSGILEIKIEENGWKYVSNKKIRSADFPSWYNNDFSFTAGLAEYEYAGREDFRITKGSEVSKLVIYGPLSNYFYMSDFPVGLFVTEGGIIIYDFEKEHIRTVTELPTKYDKKHEVLAAFMDGNNNIIIAYVREDFNPYAPPIEIAVLDYSSFSVINYIDTGTPPQKTYSIRLEEEENKIIIRYPDFGRTEEFFYLEEPLNPIEMPKVPEDETPSKPEKSPSEEPEEEKYSDKVLEKLMKIHRTSESYVDDIVNEGYTCYGTEKAFGYENLLAFAKGFPENKEDVFYITEFRTMWTVYKIAFSEENGWIFTECTGKIKEFPIWEIKIYDNRITVYFESGGKKVIYEKGSELGHPINNCSHPSDSHYIEIGIINYINSDEFRAEYQKSNLNAFLTFDEYTKTLYSEEEECLMNIYHYIEYYGLDYEDFIAAYGSEERIEEIWGNADIKGYFNK